MRETSTRVGTPGASWSLALLAHAIWGSYPVVSKLLLREVPPFALIALGYAVTLLVAAPWLPATLREMPRWGRATWLLLLAVSGRMITNILSISLTLAIYVQMINLLTPFAVVLLGRTLFGERVPPRTGWALGMSTLGSGLILLAGGAAARPATHDLLGLACALASTLCLAFYMLLTRHVQRAGAGSAWTVLIQQMLILEAAALVCSALAGERWASWLALSWQTWLVFAGFVLINLLGGNFVQIAALRRLSTALFTGLLGTRLVSALLLAWLLLGEQLRTAWQVLGAMLVVGAVTWYLRGQRGARA